MATLVLTTAASALTASAPGWVAAAATLAASAAGAWIDNSLFGRTVEREGPRLADLQVQASTEGAPIPELAGRMRLAGQLIWATRFREVSSTESSGGGGKGGGGRVRQKVTTFSYFASFAVGLCEGPVDRLWRVWADGKPLDLAGLVMRFHPGNADQMPDPLIEGVEGSGNAPAYRRTAYVVFENLPLERFGNRLPQLVFEVFRRVGAPGGDGLEDLARAVTLIPGSGEFAYDTQVVTAGGQATATGTQSTQNRSGGDARADWHPAIDDLAASLPKVGKVFLVVGWFGDDLRCGHCQIRPKADKAAKFTFAGRNAVHWRVHGQTRDMVPVVSIDGATGRVAYGGTPSDESLVRAIRDLKARGFQVVLYPFLFMDVPAGNGLPDPNAGGTGQPAYPWRGRITVAPRGADGTSAVTAQVAAFAGAVDRAQIGVSLNAATNGVAVSYAGPAEWSYRRMILHYAHLVAAVNGIAPGAVTGFLIGSELRGLTTLRDDAGAYPFVAELRALAADCRAIMGASVKLSYGADWSEYFGHQPADGSGDVHFHLDPLWADANIDFVGIDNYLPLTDWRDGAGHLDQLAGWQGPHDPLYLAANIEAGEGFDWYYASDADRLAQARTPITDGAHGKPWVFRPKDLRSWWSNLHFDRPGGVEAGMPTAWVPMSKPVWFTELGVPSVDRGTNQPNVFYDPKSAESGLPHFSAGTRDDVVQRAGIEAWLRYWRPGAGHNPVSPLYGGRMIAEQAVWTWDARPFPAWPARDDLWGDGDLWPLGHWLNGKVGLADLGGLVALLCARGGLGPDLVDVTALRGSITGYLRDRPVSPRAEIEVLMQAHGFDAVETGGTLRFVPRGQPPGLLLAPGDLAAADRGDADFTLGRAQETDLPAEVTVSYVDPARDYRRTTVASRRIEGGAIGRASLVLPLVMDEEQARLIAERLLIEAWVGRETLRFALPPSRLALDPGDVAMLSLPPGPVTFRLDRISDAGARRVEAVATAPGLHRLPLAGGRPSGGSALPAPSGLAFEFMDLPLIDEDAVPHASWVAAAMTPATPISVLDSATGDSFALDTVLPVAATMGITRFAFYNGPADFWDEGNVLGVELYAGTLASVTRDALLAGPVNALALRNGDGDWEIVQFAEATPVGDRRYDLRGLLRGRLGTEQAMRAPLPAGAPVVLLDGALRQLDMAASERNVARYYRYGPAHLAMTDPAWTGAGHVARGIGLRPYAPVHVTGVRDAAGNLTVRWVRRTRSQGTWADFTDVPLAEETERYEVDILDGAGPGVKRVIDAALPQFVYDADTAIADFGFVPSALVIRVAQCSAVFGRGLSTTALI